MSGRRPEDISLILNICHYPSISALKFSRGPGLLAVIFPSALNFMSKFLSIIFSDYKRRKKNIKILSREKSGSLRFIKIFINDTVRRNARLLD